jgi:replicative DNA helicase
MALSYPYSEQSEKAALGAMLMSEESVILAMSSLDIEDFYVPSNRITFKAIKKVYERKVAVDVTTVTDELVAMNELDNVGGVAQLVALTEGVLTTNIQYYVDIIREKTNLRSFVDLINKVSEDFQDSGIENSSEYLDNVERQITAISRNRKVGEFQTSEEVVKRINERFYRDSVRTKRIGGVESGYKDLDKITDGFQKGDMVILAARPSMGKTALALNLVVNAARIERKPVAVFSLEMPAEAIVQRMISASANVNSDSIRTMNFSTDEIVRFEDGLKKVANYEIYIDDTPGARLMDIQTKARKLKSQRPELAMVVIDYLNLITLGRVSKNDNRQQEVSEISRGIKALARELELPVICLAQLSRGVEKRQQNRRPILSDLRESGAIEQDADIVMFIHREDYYEVTDESYNKDTSAAELILSKHRNGPTGIVSLMFLKQFSLFNSALKEYNKDPK